MALRPASLLLFLGLALAAPAAAQEMPPSLTAFLDAEEERFIALYKTLHAEPELSFQEEKTAARLGDHLESLGFTVTRAVGGHGVVGVLENGEGPTVLVRADMDALPLTEKTGLAYASRAVGLSDDGKEVPVMHACGHDMHMATWAGTAAYLAGHRELWSGTMVFIGQPAEERGAGAKAMLAEGLFERFPRPDACLALHVKGELPAGSVGLCSGYTLGNVDSVDVLVRGQGGHGSTPHLTKDPVVLAARIVVALQTLVSREVPPLDDAVVTVGSIHGGLKHNIIPDEVKMQLTVRSYKPEVRRLLLEGIARTARGEAISAGFPEELHPVTTVHEDEFTPATWNDPATVARMEQVFTRLLGEDQVFEVLPVMGGEDFGRYGPAADAPSMIYWLGTSKRADWEAAQAGGPPTASTHQSHFAPDPGPSWRTGVATMSTAALTLLAELEPRATPEAGADGAR
ncbi:MAG: amidohydrolase [Planctomycetota bacterium]|jgi:hippurate hydrolase